MATAKSKAPRPVIVTTEHRGVFFGYATDTSGSEIHMTNVRMPIKFGTTRGLLELSDTGPTHKSLVSARAERMEIRKITAVIDVAPEAVKAWEAA